MHITPAMKKTIELKRNTETVEATVISTLTTLLLAVAALGAIETSAGAYVYDHRL